MAIRHTKLPLFNVTTCHELQVIKYIEKQINCTSRSTLFNWIKPRKTIMQLNEANDHKLRIKLDTLEGHVRFS